MRLRTLMLPALLHAALAPAQVVFTKLLGEDRGQWGVGVIAETNGYWVAARAYDASSETHRPVVMRCDMDGSLLTRTALPIPGRVFLQTMVEATDGDRFLCGSTFAPGALDHDGLVARVAPNDDLVWTAHPAQAGHQQYLGAAPLPDGGLLTCGTHREDSTLPLVCRFGADGTLIWQRTLPEAGGIAHAVATDGTGMVVAGRRKNPSGQTDMWMARLDMDGNTHWTTAQGGSADEDAFAILRLPDGHFLAAGHTDSHGPVDSAGKRRRCIYLVKVHANTGDTLWTRTIGDILYDRTARSIAATANGQLLLAGHREYLPGSTQALVQRLTNTGDLLWERTYQAGKEDRLVQVRALPDGLVATGASYGSEEHKVLLIRRDALGE
jgi:outer membrane protein assembly factor BamB